MPRLERISPFSGSAAGYEAALDNPLELVSRDLYLDDLGKPMEGLQRWEMPNKKIGDIRGNVFQRHRSADPLVVIGGFEFLKELGVVASWFANDATRTDAKKLIEQRGWNKTLDGLSAKGREHNVNDLFGKGAINDFLKHSPDVRRDMNTRSRADMSRADRANHIIASRTKHVLRLRKAIEFVTLVEAILAYRYSTDRTKRRTRNYTGIDIDHVYPHIVWDVLWFEPVNYTLSYLPNKENFSIVLENAAVMQTFVEDSGQLPEALWWIMNGLPGKHRTVAAAAKAVYSALNNAPPHVTTVSPTEYKVRMKLLSEKVSKDRKLAVESVVEPGPKLDT